MKPVPCPKCGARIALDDSAQGEDVRCPLCGASFEAPIEVSASAPDDPAKGDTVDPDDDLLGADLEVRIEEDVRRLDTELSRLLGARPGMGGRVITIHRQVQGNPGCCLGGCAILIFLAIVFLLGFRSLLQVLFGA